MLNLTKVLYLLLVKWCIEPFPKRDSKQILIFGQILESGSDLCIYCVIIYVINRMKESLMYFFLIMPIHDIMLHDQFFKR